MNESSSRITAQQSAARSRDARSRALAVLLGRADPVLEATLGSTSLLLGRLRVLEQRLDQERLQIAVLGQFKRGKSTFINALLGADLLPTGVIPLTAVATFIAWGNAPLVIVHFKGDRRNEEYTALTADAIREVLFRFVAEEANPKNHLSVERVEVFYPAGILANGTVLIDTPGIGSTLKHNTQAAMQVLPECDAAFFVLSADPPITEIELDYLLSLKAKTPRVFFILNKADFLAPDEQAAAVEFLQKVLGEHALIGASELIFCISAHDGLDAKQNRDEHMLVRSDILKLEDHLVRSLASEKQRWLEDGVRSKAEDILAQASTELSLRVRALNMPINELAAKSETFHAASPVLEEAARRALSQLCKANSRQHANHS